MSDDPMLQAEAGDEPDYEAPAVSDLDTTEGPALTAAGTSVS